MSPASESVLCFDTSALVKDLHEEPGPEWALQTLDAVHLATFVLVADPEWQFVVADHRLGTVAQAEGVDAIRPF